MEETDRCSVVTNTYCYLKAIYLEELHWFNNAKTESNRVPQLMESIS